MRKALLLALWMATLAGCAQSRSDPDAAGEASLRAFMPLWEEATSRFINGDPTLWKENASHRDDATILGALGGFGEKGWDEIGARYDWASSQYRNAGATMTVEYLNIGVSGDLGFTVAIEHQEGAVQGDQGQPTRRALRVTQIFRNEHGTWKLLHRHADPLVEKRAPMAP